MVMSEKPVDFGLDDPYQVLAEETIYNEDQWIGKVFAIYHENKEITHLRFMSMSSHGGWGKQPGFNVRTPEEAEAVINAIGRLSDRFNWGIVGTESINLRTKLQDAKMQIKMLQQQLEAQSERLQEALEEQEEELRTRADELEEDRDGLAEKIERAAEEEIEEEEAQTFLKENSWLFGVEYAGSEPKKLATSSSEFDFYLTRYDDKNVIIELKRISDPILTNDGELRAHVSKAVDQCMGYMEDTQAVSHSKPISETEDIEELRPRGIIVIGYDATDEAKEKLQTWNHTLNNVRIMTYSDLLSKAETTLENIKEDDGDE